MKQEEAWVIRGDGSRQYASEIPLTLWEAKRALADKLFSRLGYGDPHWFSIEFIDRTPYQGRGKGGETYRDTAELPREVFYDDKDNR